MPAGGDSSGVLTLQRKLSDDTPLVFLASVPVALFISGTAARLMWLALILTGGLSARWLRQPAGSDG